MAQPSIQLAGVINYMTWHTCKHCKWKGIKHIFISCMTLWPYMYCIVAGKVIPKPLEGLDLDFLRLSGSAYRSNMGVKVMVTEYPPASSPAARTSLWLGEYKKRVKIKVKRSYFTLVTQNSHVTNKPEADSALILPPSHHQCSVLQVFKATYSNTERKEVKRRIWGHTRQSNLGPPTLKATHLPTVLILLSTIKKYTN